MKRTSSQDKMIVTATYKVNRSNTLLEFLLAKCNNSRNNIKSLLSNKQVLVNGSLVTQFNFPLVKDDEIKISKYPITNQTAKRVKEKKKTNYSIAIIYEDDDFIAIDKPAGLLSVPSDKEQEETAYNLLLQFMTSEDKNSRPFILHRIDKETSGVLVFAKNPVIHSKLRLNWNEYVTRREYVAVVEGHLAEPKGEIKTYLGENRNNLMYVSNNKNDQLAITEYKVVKQNNEYSLVKVNIKTGRKNQIRVHMNYLGHPIIGDDKYESHHNPLKRLGLHASRLVFTHPDTEEEIVIEAPIPGIFKGMFSK